VGGCHKLAGGAAGKGIVGRISGAQNGK